MAVSKDVCEIGPFQSMSAHTIPAAVWRWGKEEVGIGLQIRTRLMPFGVFDPAVTLRPQAEE